MKTLLYQSGFYSLYTGEGAALRYCLADPAAEIPFSWPVLEIDGEIVSAAPETIEITDRRFVNGDIEELTLAGAFGGKFTLTVKLRVCAATPFLRVSYAVSASSPAYLTKQNGERLTYLQWPRNDAAVRTEIRLSEYNRLAHGYALKELPAFQHEEELIGPLLAEEREGYAMLAAYEHGSTAPDTYVCFAETDAGTEIRAVKGNYPNRHPLHAHPLETIWFQLGAVKGDKNALARAYRAFQLSYCTLNAESRRPYIFYNTWAFQERNKFYNKQWYLTSMRQERIEQEIGIAHKMGVDVFVLDAGWFRKAGDWLVNRDRFPDGMAHIRDLLDARGMKLGLWFGPTSAALSSEILQRHPKDLTCLEGETPGSYGVWETEESYEMCMASSFWEDFADRLIYLAQTLGVRYFKWDGVGMYGCDRANHYHGDENTTAQDRHDCYSFSAGVYLSKAADKLCAAVPDAIVDMDITECGRYVGLGFLSSGKYFAINNGPYFQDYDISMPGDVWSNMFVQPGAARTWIMRQGLSFDKWIPSVLTMAHYLPDDPERSQLMNLASLMLGQNGIWGDLPGVSEEGVALFGKVLGIYKRLRDDITRAYPVVYGQPGEALEVYEKINEETGRGMVALFGNQSGGYTYRLSANASENAIVFGPAELKKDGDKTVIRTQFTAPEAAIVFFGETPDGDLETVTGKK
ncbi:MAG: alpha-galactosidase [Clostridia bacterium]|nr:alpha-galactosidase [Clostridia bacterium]